MDDNATEIEREYTAIKCGAGFRRMDDRLVIRVTGGDSVSFLHGMCSADIKGLKPGEVAGALFLTDHAHVIAECFVYAESEALVLETDKASWPTTRTHLEKFLVADDVEMEEQDSIVVIDIEGAQASDAVRKLAGDTAASLSSWHFDRGSRIACLPRYGAPAFTLMAESKTVAMIERLKASFPGLCDLSRQTLDILRVENGITAVGIDTSERTLALEARLERSISFNKGCYVGQETVERATARGSLKRHLCGLRVEGTRVPERHASILLEGKEVGTLTSVVNSPAFGIIGLGILHHSAWGDGTAVSVRDMLGELPATVTATPFTKV